MQDFRSSIVEITVDDHSSVWINVNGICALRSQNTKQIIIDDKRCHTYFVVHEEGTHMTRVEAMTPEDLPEAIVAAGIPLYEVNGVFNSAGNSVPASTLPIEDTRPKKRAKK